MLRGVRVWIFGTIAGGALIALAGCGHNFYSGEREAWRGEAEIACLNSGAVKESPTRVRISPISGPGMCGADYPIQVSALGESGPLGYDDEPVRPPAIASVERGAAALAGAGQCTRRRRTAPGPARNMDRRRLPSAGPPIAGRPAQLGPMRDCRRRPAAAGRPMSLYAPGVVDPNEDDAAFEPEPPAPYGGSSPGRDSCASRQLRAPKFAPRRPTRRANLRRPASKSMCRSAGRTNPTVTASAGPGRSQTGGHAGVPHRLGARSMDRHAPCSPQRCTGFISPWSRSNKSRPIHAAA